MSRAQTGKISVMCSRSPVSLYSSNALQAFHTRITGEVAHRWIPVRTTEMVALVAVLRAMLCLVLVKIGVKGILVDAALPNS